MLELVAVLFDWTFYSFCENYTILYAESCIFIFKHIKVLSMAFTSYCAL